MTNDTEPKQAEAQVGMEGAEAFKPKDKTDFEAREHFKATLMNMVDANVAGIVKGKPPTEQYMSYIDAKMLGAQLSNFFIKKIGVTPAQVGVAVALSEAALAPTTEERIQLIKAAAGIGGGVAGVWMIVSGIFTALGVGASLLAGIQAWLFGIALTGPLAFIFGGVTLAMIAGYYAFSKTDHNANMERYIKLLKTGLSSAVDALWLEHGKELAEK